MTMAAIEKRLAELATNLEGASRRRNGYAYISDIQELISIIRFILPRLPQ